MRRGMDHALRAIAASLLLCSLRIGRSAGALHAGKRARAVRTHRGPASHDGDTVDFEAGYIRHLEWHRQAKDTWVWYGWSIWAGERQRWFVYATFGHSAASLDNPVPPAEDERDNVPNVVPHAEFVGQRALRVLPGALARHGRAAADRPARAHDGGPQPRGGDRLSRRRWPRGQADAQGETLWYRMVAGEPPALCPPASAAQPDGAPRREERAGAAGGDPAASIAKTTVEILNLRPTMSYGLPQPTGN